jgi:hypothetical protein
MYGLKPVPFTIQTLSLSLGDPAAANDFVAVVEDGRLAGRNGALRLVECGDDFSRFG